MTDTWPIVFVDFWLAVCHFGRAESTIRAKMAESMPVSKKYTLGYASEFFFPGILRLSVIVPKLAKSIKTMAVNYTGNNNWQALCRLARCLHYNFSEN